MGLGSKKDANAEHELLLSVPLIGLAMGSPPLPLELSVVMRLNHRRHKLAMVATPRNRVEHAMRTLALQLQGLSGVAKITVEETA